jgi:hypothetical protein
VCEYISSLAGTHLDPDVVQALLQHIHAREPVATASIPEPITRATLSTDDDQSRN